MIMKSKEIKTLVSLRKVQSVKFTVLVATVVLLLSSVLSAAESDTRVGVLTPFFHGQDSSIQKRSVQIIQDKLHEYGGYNVYTERRMRDAIEVFEDKYPTYCHEPRCAAVLGATLELDRMIYGTVVQNDDRFAVELTLIDVASRKIVNETSLEGEAGVALEKVVTGAMNKIHDVEDTLISESLSRYYGEEVDNKKMMYIAGGSWIAAGLAYGLIGNEFQSNKETNDPGELSGIDPAMRTVPKSARAKGMGNCYVAAAKDAYGAFYNPAGAAWTKGMQAAVSYRNHFGMVSSMSAAFVGKATREIGWGHTFSYAGSKDSYFQELDFGTIFSYKFNDLFGKLPPISLGAALNISSNRTTGGSGSEYDQTGTEWGFGFDFGLLMELTRKIDLGIVFYNAPHLIFHHNSWSEKKSVEPRPTSYKVGATYEVRYGTLLIAEGTLPLSSDQTFRFAGGLEQRLFSVLLIRLGAEKETLQSYDAPWHLTAGFGFDVPIKERHIYIDGAFDFNTSRELLGIWDVSIKVDI